jgi:hypothetical protein
MLNEIVIIFMLNDEAHAQVVNFVVDPKFIFGYFLFYFVLQSKQKEKI